jgi:hypothetical protein
MGRCVLWAGKYGTSVGQLHLLLLLFLQFILIQLGKTDDCNDVTGLHGDPLYLLHDLDFYVVQCKM